MNNNIIKVVLFNLSIYHFAILLGTFIIEGIDDLAIIKEGDLIYTTGLGEVYPTGILIGKVTRISKDHFDLSYNLKITPSSNFNNFHYVGVLDRGES